MQVIGLTGGTGSGKSVVSQWMGENGATVVDADAIAHGIIAQGKPAYLEIVEYYGNEILDLSGNIIRKELGKIVFKNPEKLKFLNQCTHKYIYQEITEQIQQANSNCVVLDAPLLFEAGLQEQCDTIWVVVAEESVRAERIMHRDGLTHQEAMERIATQKSRKEYEALADVIIDNSEDLPTLLQKLEQLLPLMDCKQ